MARATIALRESFPALRDGPHALGDLAQVGRGAEEEIERLVVDERLEVELHRLALLRGVLLDARAKERLEAGAILREPLDRLHDVLLAARILLAEEDLDVVELRHDEVIYLAQLAVRLLRPFDPFLEPSRREVMQALGRFGDPR